ncbi:hypothetical protein L3C95_08960 [Chitinophaga filiformis]|uniref:hypothetical protein n=1 Tax=Chitinophaga filiformis TaxID=104663 RepID=UPI001F267D1F|nr:hypothetical protein [Chitinophaga filiformis]MCF6403000.1 hypothetical protein [Chitinophaga filiformis]
MAFRGFLPYIGIVVGFGVIYWLTMMIPNNILYLGFKSSLLEAERKTIYQEHIFTYGLSLVLLMLNLAELLSSREDRYWLRIIKSVLTVIFAYAAGAVVFLLMNTQEWNMYLYAREIPAWIFCGISLAMTIGLLLVLQILSPMLRAKAGAGFLEDYLPSWLRFDR